MRAAAILAAVTVLSLASCRLFAPDQPQEDRARGESNDVQRSSGLSRALADAQAGVDDPALRELLRDHWERTLTDSPVFATRLGVHDFDDRLPDEDLVTIARRRIEYQRLARRGREIDATSLSARDRVSLTLLLQQLDVHEATAECRDAEWNVGVHANVVSRVLRLPEEHRVASRLDGANLVARYRAVPRLVDQHIAALTHGLDDGLVASQGTLERVLALVDRALAAGDADDPLLDPVRVDRDWPADARRRFADDLTAAVHEAVRPAFARYRALLAERLVPQGRDDAAPGLAALAIGPACYRARILEHTSLPLTADEVHALGQQEIARIDAELSALGAKALGTADLAATVERLRGDPTLYFASEDEVEAAARAAVEAAERAMPAFFGILPRAPCVVRRVPDYEAPLTHIGYYEPPHADGSKPGEYFVNTWAPTTRPRFEARVLAVHESIPGHHLQIAIGQELTDLPAFRRHGGHSAFVEGWALYTERLAEAMGLYETDLDRLGVLSFDAWRASRLVVDSGVHALGWSRAQGEAFMLQHTALTPANVVNEVDRYIAWPGQALAYKIGQLRVLELRARAEQALGDRFDVRAFHDAVLGGGAVTIPLLQARIDAWIAAQGRGG